MSFADQYAVGTRKAGQGLVPSWNCVLLEMMARFVDQLLQNDLGRLAQLHHIPVDAHTVRYARGRLSGSPTIHQPIGVWN